MTAETLRRAAALMRQRAERATPGPWWPHRDEAEMVWYGDEALTYRLDARPDEYDDADWDAWAETTGQLAHGVLRRAEDAEHIGSWHPIVAIAVADWLDDIGERHKPDPEPAELCLHYDAPCPTGECEEPGYHTVTACWSCYPTHAGMDGRAVYPCVETKAALAVARTYLGEQS